MGDWLSGWRKQTGRQNHQLGAVGIAASAEYAKELARWQQMMQQAQMPVGRNPRSYPFAIDEDFILIEWARRRMGEFEMELYSSQLRVASTSLQDPQAPWVKDPYGQRYKYFWEGHSNEFYSNEF